MARRVFRQTTIKISPRDIRRLAARPVARVNQPADVSPSRLLISVFVFHTWDQNNPGDFSVSKMTSSTFVRGYNWQTWKNALTARIVARGGTPAAEIIEDNPTNTVYFKGEAILDLGAMCDIAWYRHGTPTVQVNAVKARSTIGTKVLQGFINVESINQCHGYTTFEDQAIEILRPAALTAKLSNGCTKPSQSPTVNGWNAYGCNIIDKYEHSFATDITFNAGQCSATFRANSVACPHTPAHNSLPAYSFKPGEDANISGKHTFDTDMRLTAFFNDLVQMVLQDFFQGSPNDGMVIDNVLHDPYKGSALNFYPDDWTPAVYQAAYKAILATFRTQFPASFYVWGNAPESTSIYSAADIRNRFLEFAFRRADQAGVAKTLTEIQTMLQAVKDNALRVQLGVVKGLPPATDPWGEGTGPGGSSGTWADVAAHIRALGIVNNVYIQAARSTSGGYIYWQPEFRDLK